MSRLTKATLGVLPTITTLTCLGLAGWIWLPYNDESTARQQTQAVVTPAPATTIADELNAGAEALVSRPLFHISRRPPAAPEAAPEAAPVEVTLSLTGVIESGDVQIALLRLSNNPEPLRRRVGENVGDWQITDITKTSITVVAPNGEEQIIGLSPSNP
ncbi:hypothetical protein SLH49_21385 [Cognatiyoonia sp. IB215446]|uniref:hypothetical protein n=1 Tax=Cognatiyoonia sp. IB215446 TaxID=3097355 RepID=UPI002A14CD7D|nr:hypothetical protein [Cognatiyoonia sp. IB215446]MDX8350551.1 hypothetical protein [Cognatiyoonia sp. IB215446]